MKLCIPILLVPKSVKMVENRFQPLANANAAMTGKEILVKVLITSQYGQKRTDWYT